MPLYQAIYASASTSVFEKSALKDILSISRENNTRDNVTGILLYKEGNFMQVLEGEEQTVKDLLEKISADRRHKSILKLRGKEIDKREFSDWSMAFRDLEDVDLHRFPGYSDFLNTSLHSAKFEKDESLVTKFIANFIEINR